MRPTRFVYLTILPLSHEDEEEDPNGTTLHKVGEDDGLGALRDGDKDCRVDDEALDLDDSWLMRENEDSNGVRD
ncbi:hypothetical protein VIGAN_07245100 [Vigna angularis var. angularis]|uniref:Uncharacterized protein n=1 Tax=Vigna angularis var. angularis TaxID=157739 RepID=A0A0S3SL57_PHAAN|nr:hypothetical protein VIGAN_07245100 [Vigna angularis var. angularis]